MNRVVGNVLDLWELHDLAVAAVDDGNVELAERLRTRYEHLQEVDLVCSECGTATPKPIAKRTYTFGEVASYACRECDARGVVYRSATIRRYEGNLAHPTWAPG